MIHELQFYTDEGGDYAPPQNGSVWHVLSKWDITKFWENINRCWSLCI